MWRSDPRHLKIIKRLQNLIDLVLEWGRHPSLIPLSSLELEGDWWAKMLASSHKDVHIFSILLQKIPGSMPNTPEKKMFNIFPIRSGAWSRSTQETALFCLKRCLSGMIMLGQGLQIQSRVLRCPMECCYFVPETLQASHITHLFAAICIFQVSLLDRKRSHSLRKTAASFLEGSEAGKRQSTAQQGKIQVRDLFGKNTFFIDDVCMI